MRTFVCLIVLAAFALAEPPVPSSSYGVPDESYGPPDFGSHTQAVLRPNGNGNGYHNGNGHRNGNGKPSATYGAPKSTYGAPKPEYGAPNGGEEEAPASYSFEYAVKDEESGNDFGHQESREGDVAQGKYYVLLPDGRKQIVEYTADNDGYHPKVSYEETGNGNSGYARGPANGGYPRGPANGNGRGNGGYQY